MGYNEDIPGKLVAGVVLRDDAALVKTLTEPQAEPLAIELPELVDPGRPRCLAARLWAFITAPLKLARRRAPRSQVVERLVHPGR